MGRTHYLERAIAAAIARIPTSTSVRSKLRIAIEYRKMHAVLLHPRVSTSRFSTVRIPPHELPAARNEN